MRIKSFTTAIVGALVVLGLGCVADRPARNGVFNENQYVRKDFLIQGTDANGNAAGTDPGWLMRATVSETSTPNVLGSAIDIWGGLMGDVNLVRFRVTQDKLQLLSMLQFSNPVNTVGNNNIVASNPDSTTAAIVNAWPATNVDLKYRVNLDGETTNFYEENQELDWEVRQWVKLQFDKNDFSDLAPLGTFRNEWINKCADTVNASATLVTDSFVMEGDEDTDPSNDYMEFTVQVALPMNFNDSTCLSAYGIMATTALEMVPPRTTVTVNLKYSFKRATPPAQITYKPLILAEKDPIRRKYGPILMTTFDRDEATQLIAANQYVGRYDPAKPIVWYFDQNFPENYKCIFRTAKGCPTGAGAPVTIEAATNALLAQAAAANPEIAPKPITVSFLEYNAPDPACTPSGTTTCPPLVRQYGDIRYNFLRWASDQDIQDSFAGVTMPGYDPRTGEMVNQGIEFNDFAVLNYYVERIDSFLVQVGASSGVNQATWPSVPPGMKSSTCTVGQTLPVVDATDISVHDASSTLFTKMQQYLNLNGPDPTNNHLGPKDFVDIPNSTDPTFLNAYLAIAPYELFADPTTNPFVIPEGQAAVFGPSAVWQDMQNETTFQQTAATINSGKTPYSPNGVLAAANFMNQMRSATDAHMQHQLTLTRQSPYEKRDVPDSFSLETVMEQDSRQCVCSDGTTNCGIGSADGTWETRDQWVQHIIDTYWQQVLWHEFGHSMGLEHNFMGSIDQPNFTAQRDKNGNVLCDDGSTGSKTTCTTGHTLYDMYSSSVMEYSSNPARLAWTQGWGYYDAAAITWIYANNGVNTKSASAGKTAPVGNLSGQVDKTYPYFDPNGYCTAGSPDCNTSVQANTTDGAYERRFLRCDETHLKYSPLCRQGDTGVTPSEIIANEIDTYEWQYIWRNFRNYNKVWDVSNYANNVAGTIVDMRRFLSQWYFDWDPGNIADTLHRIGIVPPPNSDNGSGVSSMDYYNVVTQAFFTEMSKTNSMVAAFDEAVIQQAAGERPYATVYDDFYGDETQQGIILDKFFAMQSFVGLWVSDNYDQNQAGTYISSWGDFGFDASYNTVAQTAVRSMVGSQYASYPYFIPTAVALFAQDTHSPSFVEVVGTVEGGAGGGTASPFPQENDKDWIGGWVFYRQEDLINFFRTIALNSCANNTDLCLTNCVNFDTCTYDVTDPTQVNQNLDGQIAGIPPGEFTGPDGLNYMYAYVASRNEWVVARQDRNIVTWQALVNFNTNLYQAHDDGSNGQYQYEYQIEYTIDSYETYEQTAATSDSAGSQLGGN
jgi:hypothetical protein